MTPECSITKIPVLLFLIWSSVLASVALGAAPNEALLKAKQEAESHGYIFVASRDEIVAKAKKEGRLRALSGLSTPAIKPMIAAFKKKYPFIDTYVEEIEGTDAYQRFLLELKAGVSKGWDSTYLPYDNYKAFLPYQMKIDIFGMISAGILNIHPRMVDPVNRNTVSANTIANVAVYNRKLIAEEKVPTKWEDFLKPEFKGRKFMAEIGSRAGAGVGTRSHAGLRPQACRAGPCMGQRWYESHHHASGGRVPPMSRCSVK
jgi:hypothetical protein